MTGFYFSDLRSSYLKKTLPTGVYLTGDMETVGREGQKELFFSESVLGSEYDVFFLQLWMEDHPFNCPAY